MNKYTKLLTEALRVIKEEEMGGLGGTPATPSQDMPAVPPQETPRQPSPAGGEIAPQGAQGEPITLDTIISKLNVIRGGKSFNDPEMYGKLTTYFNETPEADKIVLDRNLTKLSEIMSASFAQQSQTSVGAAANTAQMPPGGPPADQSRAGAATPASPQASPQNAPIAAGV